MAKPATFLAVGASGAYLYNNSDIVEGFMKDGTKGLLHSLTAPRANPSNAQDVRQLQNMVTTLTSQMDSMASNQRTSHQIIVASSQPSTILGFQTWKVIGVVGTAGIIYFKVKGYELRDLVYVSKRHFNTVADALKKQYENLDETVKAVKTELLKRIGMVESRVDEAQKSIENKIDSEVGRLSGQIDGVSASVSKLDVSLSDTSKDIKIVGTDVLQVKSDLQRVADGIDQRLDRMHLEVEDFKDTTTTGHNEMKREMGKIDHKIDGLSRSTHATLNSLQVGLDRQSKGINLLCEFVRQTQQPQDTADSNRKWLDELDSFTREYKTGDNSSNGPMKRRTSGLTGLKTISATGNF
eukprot:c6555_g1_i1.p1 GENE.c6555_g1_i1~~c6555_g1_i1.p1  ORF type:complete len:353 (-),score=103.17 c6555_g1_i1:231-1289(-)